MFFRKLCRNSIYPSAGNSIEVEERQRTAPAAVQQNQDNLTSGQVGKNRKRGNSNIVIPSNSSTSSVLRPGHIIFASSESGNNQGGISGSYNHYSRHGNGNSSVNGASSPPRSPPPSYSVVYPSVAIIPSDPRRYEYPTSSGSSDESVDESLIRRRTYSQSLEGYQCPDLLHACSLILSSSNSEQERQQSVQEGVLRQQCDNNINGNTSKETNSILGRSEQEQRRSDSLSSVEYAEINENLREEFSQVKINDVQRIELEIRKKQEQLGKNGDHEGCLTDPSDQAMGQNLSLRRPRISLTWVLREQQQQQQQNQQGQQKQQPHDQVGINSNSTNHNDVKKPSEKKKSKSKNGKEEKLFSEKYRQHIDGCEDDGSASGGYCTHDTSTNFGRSRSETKHFNNRQMYKILEHSTEMHNDCDVKSLKGTYSEPSLIAASEGGHHHRRHRHRKRRGDRNRLQKFGYEIRNVDEFLSKCSLSSPGNIPVVLSSSSILYQTRPGGYQMEIPLPLGMVVNAVFKNQNWLYVQTPHAEEGYIGYSTCLPLGILPPPARTNSTSKPTPCWETNGDIFPRPCGNMTDSEKEIHIGGGTRSEGARTPRLKRTSHGKSYGEHNVDKLYLRAASQPKLTEKSYAHLKSTISYKQQQLGRTNVQQTNGVNDSGSKNAMNDEYVLLQNKFPSSTGTKNTSVTSNHRALKQSNNQNGNNNLRLYTNGTTKSRSVRQTLVAITNDYATDSIVVHKGEIVTLLECKESKDRQPWFYIQARDGREGFIPAEYAGHGFL